MSEEEEVLEECAECGVEIPEGEEFVRTAGAFYQQLCEECFYNYIFNCYWCGNECELEDGRQLNSNGELICFSCADYHTLCEVCEDDIHVDDAYWSERGGSYLCHHCYNENEPDAVRPWGDRPQLVFHDEQGTSDGPLRGKTYFGIEIEVAACPMHVPDDYASSYDNHEERMWITTDSSVESGYEFVTMPGTLEAIQNGKVIDWDRWSQHVHHNVPPQEQEYSNGIHVHINRGAFDSRLTKYDRSLYYGGETPPSSAHLYRFMHFLQSHDEAVQTIAGRAMSDYCMWDYTKDTLLRAKDAKGDIGNHARYRPINTQNPDTIEVRIFDGRTDRVFILRAVEFLHSVLEYTRKIRGFGTWEGYVAWLKENRALYFSDLYLVVSDHGLVRRALSANQANRMRIKAAMKKRKEAVAKSKEYSAYIETVIDRLANTIA